MNIIVLRTSVTHGCVPAEGGELIPILLAEPQPCFIVAMSDEEGQRPISIHGTQLEATEQAQRIEEEFSKMGMGGTPGGQVQ